MSTSFNHFVSNNGQGTIFKSFNHASKLYVANNYARAPKLGFLYYVYFNINDNVVGDQGWANSAQKDVGLLVKKIDMPKFKIATETVNQYNRKVNVQSKLTYEPVSIEFHDDNSDITNGLWKNYYKYYFVDSNYNSGNRAYWQNSKYSTTDYAYGLGNYQNEPFFDTIEIFVLHQQKFTQMILVNPLVTAWDHDKLDQSNGNNILTNKMTVAYENVVYLEGEIEKNNGTVTNPPLFALRYYDNVASPLSVGGNILNSTPAANGKLPNDAAVFGKKPPYPQYKKPLVGYVQNWGGDPNLAEKAYAQQPSSGLSIGLFMGHLQISGTQQLGPLKLGFNVSSGRGGLKGVSTINAGPVTLAKKI
jgi:hypothetical protein